MTNYEIADQFSLLSKLMDIHGENSFKSKSYGVAAYNIEKLPKEVESMDDAELFSIRGFGDSIGQKIREIQNTGTMDALQLILEKTPVGILEMMQVKGIGPKKIAVIWKEMGIESVGELEYACNENRLVNFKGFGTKTQESILQNIAFIRSNMGFHLWAEVEGIANLLVSQLQRVNPGKLFALSGGFRRQLPTLEHLDIITTTSKGTIQQQFGVTAGIKIEEQDNLLFIQAPNQPAIKLHPVADETAFYRTLFNTSGSKDFVEAFYEQFKLPDVIKSEDEIFAHNSLAVIHPAMREHRNILVTAQQNKLPELIQVKDIKSIIHSHSTWSDGSYSIEQMAKAAIDKGFEYMVISDHSQAAYYANGLTPERIAAQHQEVDALNEKLAPFKIFKSIEADILSDGNLDYNPQILSTFDLVIASVHSNLKMTQERAMERVLAAVRNPFTSILGHPTGRLLLSREGYPLDHKMVIDECAANNVVIEINAHPRRLDIDWRWIEYALEKGVTLSINPDAHAIEGYHDVYYGVLAAQKGGLTAAHNLSSFTLAQFEGVLKEQRKKRLTVTV